MKKTVVILAGLVLIPMLVIGAMHYFTTTPMYARVASIGKIMPNP